MMLTGLTIFNSYIYNQQTPSKCENPQNDINSKLLDREKQQQQKIEALQHLVQYDICNSSDIQENQIQEFILGDTQTSVIVIRSEGKLYALGGICVYDDHTSLKDGVCFGNKLYCPKHGCAYNITSGTAEYAPALDNLPIFYIEEKNNRIQIYMPKFPPIKVRPPTSPRDYNDLRKVVIIGANAAAHACVETLRSHGYAGEITIISRDTKLPYDKTQLTRTIKNSNYEDLKFRSDEWYDKNGVTYLLGRSLVSVDNTHQAHSIEIDDGTKIEYDTLLIATGVKEEHRLINGMENKKNLIYYKSINDTQKLRSYLEKSSKLVLKKQSIVIIKTVIGCNMKSMETVSTIRREYPHIEVLVVDENDEHALQSLVGKQISDSIINYHLQNGVQFLFQDKIDMFESKQNIDEIDNIRFIDGLEVQTDAIICFPNNFEANTDFLEDSKKLDNLELDQQERIKCDVKMTSEHKRVFVAGKAAIVPYFYDEFQKIPCTSQNMAQNQGVIVAYNMLGLGIPFHMIPFQYYQMYDKTLQHSGYSSQWNDLHIIGDPSSLEFLAIYGYQNTIFQVIGTQKYQKEVKIFNEAFRLDVMPTLSMFKENIINVELLEKELHKQKRSGCFKDLIWEIRYEPKNKEILFRKRDSNQNEYYNWYKQGVAPAEAPSFKKPDAV